jgi:hypothetical protein
MGERAAILRAQFHDNGTRNRNNYTVETPILRMRRGKLNEGDPVS